MNITAPRIRFDEIRRKADAVRALFKDQSVPVDILSAAEFDLHYEIRPVKNLGDSANSNALLYGDRVNDIAITNNSNAIKVLDRMTRTNSNAWTPLIDRKSVV